MRVLVDATIIKPGQGGLRTYALGVATALAERDDVEVSVVTVAGSHEDWGHCRVVEGDLPPGGPLGRAAWRERHIGRIASRLDADVVLVPAPEALRRCPVPVATVVHDLGPLMAPAFYGRVRHARYLVGIPHLLRTSAAVLCVSESTKLDLVRWSGVDPSTVGVALNAPQVGLVPGASGRPPSETGDGGGHDGGFALYVGAALPHKNLRLMTEVFGPEGGGTPTELLIAGPSYGREVEELRRTIAEKGSRIQHVGFVTPAELADLYGSAAVVVFPSLYEGFGIPLLEAMAYGVPVVASDIPALREVGGGVAHLVDRPTDASAWRRALEAAAAERGEAARARARAAAARAAEFSWAATADTIVRHLSRVV